MTFFHFYVKHIVHGFIGGLGSFIVKNEFDVQVVLVDDASDMAHLGKPLEEYTAKWTGRVHLIRSGEMD